MPKPLVSKVATFKGYNKKATSNSMLRIDKRERIIACILGDAMLNRVSPDEARNLSNIKNSDWHLQNLIQLKIVEHESNKDYFDWKVNMIQETGWLSNFETWKQDGFYIAQWCDTRKLRIYYKWIYKNSKKTFKQVLKYMHSPLFAAVLVLDNGALNQSKELAIDLGLNYGDNASLLSKWFQDILDVRSEVIKTPATHYVSFDQINTRKLLSAIKPIVKDIPSMYGKLFSHTNTPYNLIS